MADWISRLPDDILLLILSFLLTQDAIATSLLSKRWISVWLSVPTLNFELDRFLLRREEEERRFFADFVGASIKARGSRPSPIKEFRFDWGLHWDYPETDDIPLWLKQVIQHGGLENVELIISNPFYVLPRSIFTCTTLVALKLNGACFYEKCISSGLNHTPFPNGFFSSVNLPSLKTLHLTGAVFFVKSQDFMEFLYGCPILENLVANDLVFEDASFEGELRSLSKLVTADVCDIGGEDQIFYIPVIVFSNVKFLRLDECHKDIPPVFPNLIHLELVFGSGLVDISWNSVFGILQRSPKLQILDLHFKYVVCKAWSNPQSVPECFSSQLNKCVITIITNYRDIKSQMGFAKYVMQNSPLLRTMTVVWRDEVDDKAKLEMLRELAFCPRSSATCQLLFK